MATPVLNLTIEKMNRAIDIINIYLSSDTSRIIHDSGITFLLKDIYNNMFNYIFIPVMKEFNDDIKLYFKYITIVFYQPPKKLDRSINYHNTYYFTYYYLKLSLIYFKRVFTELKLKNLSELTKDIQLTLQLGVHIIFEIVYNNYRHDRVEEYIELMTNPTPEFDFWKSIICGYLIETLIGLYAKNSFVIVHINGGPDIIDVEYPDRLKFFEVKSSNGGEFGCHAFLNKNKSDASRAFDCLSIEQITRMDDDNVFRFHIQVNKLEASGPTSYSCETLRTIDINTSRLNESIVVCLKNLDYILENYTKFKGKRISINLQNSIQMKSKVVEGGKVRHLRPGQILLYNVCSHTWLMKTKQQDNQRKGRIAYSNIGNIGELPTPIITDIRTVEESKFLLETIFTDDSPMSFNVHSIQPVNDPTYYPNLNENGAFEYELVDLSLPNTELDNTSDATNGTPRPIVLPVLPPQVNTETVSRQAARRDTEAAGATGTTAEPLPSYTEIQIKELLKKLTELEIELRANHNSLDAMTDFIRRSPLPVQTNFDVEMYLRATNRNIDKKTLIYIDNLAIQTFPYDMIFKERFARDIYTNLIMTNPHTELILLHLLYNVIHLKRMGSVITPAEIINMIIIFMQIVNLDVISRDIFSSLRQLAKDIILSYNPYTINRPVFYLNNLTIFVNHYPYIIFSQ